MFGSFGVSPQIGYLICNGLAALLFSNGVYWPILIFIICGFLFFMGLLDVFLIPTAKSVLPENVKLVALDSKVEVKSGAQPMSRADGRAALTLWGAFIQPEIPWYACSYFFGRMTTYSVLAWLPFFFHSQLGFTPSTASLLAMVYDGGCIVGSIVIGAISTSLANRRGAGRPSIYALLFLLAPITLAVFVGVLLPGPIGSSPPVPTIGAVVGVTILIGLIIPVIDALAIGSITADLGIRVTEKRGMATIAGVVNSFGNVGAGIACALVPVISGNYGWAVVFYVLMGTACLAILLLIPPTYRDILRVIAGKQRTAEDAVPLLGRKSGGDGDGKLQVHIMLDPVVAPNAKAAPKKDDKTGSKRGKIVVGLDDDAGWDTDHGFEKYVVRKKQAVGASSSSSDDEQSFSDGGAKPKKPGRVIDIDDDIKIVNVGGIDTTVRVKAGHKISATGKRDVVLDDEPDTEPSSDEEGDLVKKKASGPTIADPTAFDDSYIRAKMGTSASSANILSGEGTNSQTLSAVSLAVTRERTRSGVHTTSMLERRKTKLGLMRPTELQVAPAENAGGRGRSGTIVGGLPASGTLRPAAQPRPIPLSDIKKAKEKKRPKKKKATSPIDLVDSEDDDDGFNSDDDSDLDWSDANALSAMKPLLGPHSASFTISKPPSRSGNAPVATGSATNVKATSSSTALAKSPSAGGSMKKSSSKTAAQSPSQTDLKSKGKGKAQESSSSSSGSE